MIAIFGLMIVVLTCVLVTDGVFFGCYDVPKKLFLCISVYILAWAWILIKPFLYIPHFFVTLIVAMVIVWLLAVASSINNDNAMRVFLVFLCSLFLGVFILSSCQAVQVMRAFVMAATLSVLVFSIR